jgi:hypothetical protein
MVDMGKMKKRRDESQRGADFLTFDEGETKVLIHPCCREEDDHPLTAGTNFIPVGVHYRVGKDGKMVVSLNEDKNPIISHPFIKQVLKERKVKIDYDEACPVQEELPNLSDDDQREQRYQVRYMWGMTPIATKRKGEAEWRELTFKPQIWFGGKTIHDGIMDVFVEEGDISNPDSAILVIIKRKGTKQFDTKYTVSVDTKTVRKALTLSKADKRTLREAMADHADLFKVVGNMVKGSKEVQALVDGVSLDESDDDSEDD